MGVKDLWPVILPAGVPLSSAHLSIIDGWDNNPSGLRGLRVGVDATSWLYHGSTARGGSNAALRALFYRCCGLLDHPFLVVFVFDGALRPNVKRGKVVTTRNTKLIGNFKQMIKLFGYDWMEAAGEAEAELAHMQRTSIIDIVMSEDVDAFLFGCKRMVLTPGGGDNRNHSGYSIIRNSPQKSHKSHMVVFSSDAIESAVGITQGGLIMIALLRGGDYDTEGIRNCGIRYACGIAKCGFGDELLEAARAMDEHSLTVFISSWRDRVRRELITNSSGHLPSKFPSVAHDATFTAFPNRTVLDYYVNPATSLTHPRTRHQVNWDREIDLGKLANLCQEKFSWSSDTLVSKFQKLLLRGVAVRVLRRATMCIDDPRVLTRGPSSHLLSDRWVENQTLFKKIINSRTNDPSTDLPREYLVTVCPGPLVDTTLKALDASDDDMSLVHSNGEDCPPIWLPMQLIESARPDLILRYTASHPAKTNGHQTKLDDFYRVQSSSTGKKRGVSRSGERKQTKRRRL